MFLEDCNCKGCGIICCDKPMEVLVPNSVDAAVEKHVPTYEKVEDEIVVKVNHVMEKEHFIEWLCLVKENKKNNGKIISRAKCRGKISLYSWFYTIYSYCNKHGLWKADVD